MARKNELGITVKKDEDMPEWYGQVVLKSEMAEYSAVKGCAVIRPLGYALWQSIMDYLNKEIFALEVENAYFPLFIPESFFKKEANHVEGFAPELAWIEKKEGTEERLAIRPTSETIMYDSYSRWIQSWRDLPLRINQWANVVRWEVSDVKLFLRSREFLWQEGHCVYATEEECDKETWQFLDVYEKMSEELLAIPCISGMKSDKEKFAGAKYTTTIEHFMPDGKFLQSGTSHNLGTGFAEGFDIKFRGQDEKMHTPWQSSWGISTRLLGSVVMTHGDDKGLVLPPKMAPTQVVIIPIVMKKNPEGSKQVLGKANELFSSMEKSGIKVKLDDRDSHSMGFKMSEWELKGVPLRLEIGPRDLENNNCILTKRNTSEKLTIDLKNIVKEIPVLLETIQNEMLDKAKKFLESKKTETDSYDELKDLIAKGNYVLVPHCGNSTCEENIKAETAGITTRCKPRQEKSVEGKTCFKCGKPAKYMIYFGRNY